MTPSRSVQLAILGGLALLMLATRYQAFLQHFVEMPDASWAIFFIAGFYLKGMARWVFPLLMVEAVLIDIVVTQHMGVSDFCITPAYGFLLPTHAVLWLAGDWLRRNATENLRGMIWLVASAFVSVTLAYAISNGGFYWFGGRYTSPHMAEYVDRFFMYYGHFLMVPCAYIAAAAFTHIGIVRVARSESTQDIR